jgi:hypothetical protein
MAEHLPLTPPPGYAPHTSGLLVPTPYAAPLIGRTPMFDDDGSGEVGTVLNNNWKQELYNQIDAANAAGYNDLAGQIAASVSVETIDVTAGGTFALGAAHVHILYSQSNSPITVAWTPVPPRNGDLVIYRTWPYNGTGVVRVAHDPSANAIYNRVTSAPTPMAFGGTATWIGIQGTWMLIAHEQGAWITTPFDASAFGAVAPLTWTVAAGNVARCAYRLSGRALTFSLQINGSTIGGSAGAQLAVFQSMYGNFAPKGGDVSPLVYIADAGGLLQTAMFTNATDRIYVQGLSRNFAPPYSSCAVYGQHTFEVT